MSGIDYQPQRNAKETAELRRGLMRKLCVSVHTLVILLTFLTGFYGNRILTTVTTVTTITPLTPLTTITPLPTTIPRTINLSRLWVNKIL